MFAGAGVVPAGRHSQCCPIGPRHQVTTASTADNKRGNGCSEADGTWERSIPDIADASRSPDPSTVRRWAERLLCLGTLLATTLWRATGWSLATSPTILAWDWIVIRHILPLEANSP